MSLFDHGEPEEFLLFIHNFKMTPAATGTLETDTKIQCLCRLFCGEALCQFESLYADVEIPEKINVEYIIKGLALYFPPVNFLSKQKRAMCHGMKKPRGLTVRRYTASLIDLNKYLASFPRAALADKIVVTE